jgi:hypothetical protein
MPEITTDPHIGDQGRTKHQQHTILTPSTTQLNQLNAIGDTARNNLTSNPAERQTNDNIHGSPHRNDTSGTALGITSIA